MFRTKCTESTQIGSLRAPPGLRSALNDKGISEEELRERARDFRDKWLWIDEIDVSLKSIPALSWLDVRCAAGAYEYWSEGGGTLYSPVKQ